ncbi:MAG: site-2 protease family protein [Phycisphaerales bacterium]|jgi:regulator of sigma E protease|nr:site-2 protease family protein [Phycisphaerales bacterium]
MGALGTIFDLLLVLLGFSLIIVLHELGHFLAARWAGIRVLAFAMGFGPAIFSFRKGMGFRLGSSEPQYAELLASRGGRIPSTEVSPTEYRWNWLPLGGYVRMLGQDDADPSARSEATDSYQNCVPWKRMIVISAGVVMNVITAAILFVVVFTAGLRTEPPTIGTVEPGSPASVAVALNASQLGVTQPGLLPGDKVLTIAGKAPDSFKDITIETAMAAKGQAVPIEIQREGVTSPLRFEITPRPDRFSGLLAIGVAPGVSTTLLTSSNPAERDEIAKALDRFGVGQAGVVPGSVLTAVGGQPAATPHALTAAARTSGGAPIDATFRTPEGRDIAVKVRTEPELPIQRFRAPGVGGEPSEQAAAHVLGLMPGLKVDSLPKDAPPNGLLAGDMFVRLGDLPWPGLIDGIAEIRRHAGRTIAITVLRDGALVDLGKVPVTRQGTVGFNPGATDTQSARVSAWPASATGRIQAIGRDGAVQPDPSAASLGLLPGTVIERLSVAGGPDTPIASLSALCEALRAAALAAAADLQVTLTVRLPATAAGPGAAETVRWSIPRPEAAALSALTWTPALNPAIFAREEFLLKADSPFGAVAMGLRETHRVMIQTYLTFARLFQGTVKVEHLKGPVGIAHFGTLLADRGFIWLLFFMAVISINLAVINFLPLPIVDGGHFCFLLYEQITGKPVSIAVQNIAAIAGLVMIGTVFLIVTYNDLANLLWR